jgi:hypothetical protein
MTENVMTARSEGLDEHQLSPEELSPEELDAVSGAWSMDFGLFKVTGSDAGNATRIITSFLAGTVLLAGIIIAYAQTGCSDCRPLPTNPPSPNEGGAPPPGGTGR